MIQLKSIYYKRLFAVKIGSVIFDVAVCARFHSRNEGTSLAKII